MTGLPPLVPDPQTLATLVSNVTQTMCGFSFSPTSGDPPPPEVCWRLVSLSIGGARPLRVVLSSSQRGCIALGSALFAVPPAELDAEMIDDSLRELLNMAAGQIKGALAIDQALGLPKVLTEPDLSVRAADALKQGVLLRSEDDLGLLIWISEDAT